VTRNFLLKSWASTMRWAGLGVGLFSTMVGCVYVPTVGHGLKGDRGALTASVVEEFTSHKTTRADVLLALGRPRDSRDDDRIFIYSGWMIEGYFVFAIPYSASGKMWANKRTHIVALEFTPENLLLRIKKVDLSDRDKAWAVIEAWISGKDEKEPADVQKEAGQ